MMIQDIFSFRWNRLLTDFSQTIFLPFYVVPGSTCFFFFWLTNEVFTSHVYVFLIYSVIRSPFYFLRLIYDHFALLSLTRTLQANLVLSHAAGNVILTRSFILPSIHLTLNPWTHWHLSILPSVSHCIPPAIIPSARPSINSYIRLNIHPWIHSSLNPFIHPIRDPIHPSSIVQQSIHLLSRPFD